MAKLFTAQTWNIDNLEGISTKTMSQHIELYNGYVKNANLILEHIAELSKDTAKYSYEIGELRRRFAFEFDGMRNHEYYFNSFVGGQKEIDTESSLYKKIVEDFGSFENWIDTFKTLSLTRGIGWAMLYYDKQTNQLLNSWVDEQHLGQLTGLAPILALDMWEHSYYLDYSPAEKKNYVLSFFKNLNWKVIEDNFLK